MRILARYLSVMFLKNFLMGVMLFTTIFLVQALLGEVLDAKFPIYQVVIYNLLDVPQIVVRMIPPSVLLATVVTLSNLSRTNELVACYSIGIGLKQISLIILSLVFMISCLSVVIQDRILPPVFQQRTEFYWRDMKKRKDFFLDVKKDKIWYRSKNLIYNIRSYDSTTKTIQGMSTYKFDKEFNLVEVMEARQAKFDPKEGWTLMDGTLTHFRGEDTFPISKPFEAKKVTIAETPKDFLEVEREVDGLRFRHILEYITKVKGAGADTKVYETKFWAKVSLSFIPLVMCLFAIPFSVRGRREGGLAKDLSICFGVTFFYWIFYSVSLSLGQKGTLPPVVAAWLPSAIFLLLTAGLLSYRRN